MRRRPHCGPMLVDAPQSAHSSSSYQGTVPDTPNRADFVPLSQVGRPENVVGWYHSHPGYGCWLSGIDVTTQLNNQIFDPFLAVVIDPNRTVSAGKVEIGAFRAYPEVSLPIGTGLEHMLISHAVSSPRTIHLLTHKQVTISLSRSIRSKISVSIRLATILSTSRTSNPAWTMRFSRRYGTNTGS